MVFGRFDEVIGVIFGEVFDAKFIYIEGNVVLRVLCCHRPSVYCIGSYLEEASFLTSCRNAMIPDSLRPYILQWTLKYALPSGSTCRLYFSLTSCGIMVWCMWMYW